jgi:hypothetical protein
VVVLPGAGLADSERNVPEPLGEIRDPGRTLADPSRTQLVASLATRLTDAVLAGDHERARSLAEALQALQAGPAVAPLL